MKITFPPFYLFLDFDGVLHPEGGDVMALFVHADRLGVLVTDYPEIVVVVSSSWREVYPFEELREFCGPLLGPLLQDAMGIAKLVLGSRPALHRFAEIAYWLATHPKPTVETRRPEADALGRSDWIALDDSDFWFPPACPQLLHIADGLGLCDAHFAELEARLLEHRRSAPQGRG